MGVLHAKNASTAPTGKNVDLVKEVQDVVKRNVAHVCVEEEVTNQQ
jgi:hypothetical protein